jgi:phosphocarrier protein HPr
MTASVRLTIAHPSGLHARPASAFVQMASQYQAAIQVMNCASGKGPVNAKSILSVLTLGVANGTEIELTANGTDEVEALQAVKQLVNTNFGEG